MNRVVLSKKPLMNGEIHEDRYVSYLGIMEID